MGSCEIPVTAISKEVVVPSNHHHRDQTTRLPLSNLDHIYGDNLMVSVYLCYAKPKGSDSDHRSMVAVLRESLARTLEPFPVFAGEIVLNSNGEPESLLSDRGVDFFRASTELELGDVDFYHPDVSVKGNLVPLIQQGVLAVQVTEFRCGGLVVGITFDHRVADAYSGNMFLLSWAETAQDKKPTSFDPNVNRWLLSPSQLTVDHNHQRDATAASLVEGWYTAKPRNELPSFPNGFSDQHPTLEDPEDQFTSRTFYVEAKKIKSLQEHACSKNDDKDSFRTKYEAFTAYLWQVLAKSTASAATSFKISIAVDGRSRLYEPGSHDATLMPHYFGNVVSFPFTESPAGDLRSMPLAEAADLVHRLKEATATADHFAELISFAEARRPMQPAGRVYGEETAEGAAVMVSSGQRFPVREVDFGWGKAALGSYYFPWAGAAGYVMPVPSAAVEGDWVVYMHLRRRQMEAVERDGGEVFKPLVSSYLNLS